MEFDFPVIDFHAHLIEYAYYYQPALDFLASSIPPGEDFDTFYEHFSHPENYVQMLKEAGVDYSVILPDYSPVTTGVVSNEKCEDFCKDYKELIPFCTVNPYYNPDMVDIVKEFCGNRGFKGVKLYPPYNHFYPNDPVVYPVYAAAQELGVPVQFHTGSSVYKHSRIKYGNPIYMDDVAVDFPDLVLVLAHGGRGAWYDEAMTMARIHKNVYIDLAGLPPRNFKNYFPEIERFADKFLFGTDWSQMAVKEHLNRYLNLGFSEEATQKIIGRNAAKILKIEAKS